MGCKKNEEVEGCSGESYGTITEFIKNGDSRTKVEKLIKENSLDYSHYSRDKDKYFYSRDGSLEDRDVFSKFIILEKTAGRTGLFIFETIELTRVYFNDKDKVINIDCDVVFTGL